MHRISALVIPLLACTSGSGDTDPGKGASTSHATADPSATDATSPEGSSGASQSDSQGETQPQTQTDTPTDPTDAPADTSSGVADSGTTGLGEPGPDLRQPGPHRVQTDPGSAQTSCTMAYDVFAPVDVPDAPTVILAHGFQGNRGSMVGWATHWASWGLRVVTPNLCHATIIDADHAQNGADLVELAAHLDVGPVALAGYSAGGLAAVIAAAALPDTPVLLGLDMVDSGNLGADAAPDIVAPAHDITSETAMCNSSSNGVPVFAAIDGSNTLRLVDADHCDFQNPGDNFCNLCAVDNEVNTPEAIQAAIHGLGTAALLWRLGVDDTAAQWWTPGGVYYDELFAAGLLVQL